MKKIFVTIPLTFCAFILFSQSENSNTDKKVHFGFNVGANYSLLHSKQALPSNTEIYNGIGLKLGLLMDYAISSKFIFSPKTEMSFNKSRVETTYLDNTMWTYKVFPISLDIMTHFVYKLSENKTVPYLLFGPNLRLPIKNTFDSNDSNTEFRNVADFALDFGIGLENRFEHFIFAPELRYSLGLFNINQKPHLQSLYYHNVSLVLNFK